MKTIDSQRRHASSVSGGHPNGRVQSSPPAPGVHDALLFSGILAALFYGAMNVIVPLQWPAYSIASQTVSELSAIGAPTRTLWVSLALVHAGLLIAFGFGIRATSGSSRRLRTLGGLFIASAAIGLFWPPMHLRGEPMTLTDTLHIAFTGVWLLLTLLTLAFGAAALGRQFRLYSAATLAIFIVFGTLTGLDAPRLAANLPTPWIGVWERINIGAFMLWQVVLAVALLRSRRPLTLRVTTPKFPA